MAQPTSRATRAGHRHGRSGWPWLTPVLAAVTSIPALLAASSDARALDPPPPVRKPDTAAPALAPAAATRSADTATLGQGLVEPLPGEAAYWALLDAALSPLLAPAVSEADIGRVKQAVTAIGKSDVQGARALAGQIQNEAARTLVQWSWLRRGHGDVAEYRAFLAANPDWPERWLLTQRMEEALFAAPLAPASVKALFKSQRPETGAGLAALASAHLADGEREAAKALAAEAWRNHDLGTAQEARLIERFKELLSPADHRWRLDRLLLSDRRWTTDRKERAAIAQRLLPLLSAAEQAKAKARLSVYLRAKSAAAEMAALPAETTPDWGLVFQRVQLLRRSGKIEAAAKLVLGAPTDAALIVSPDDWWEERRALAYEVLEAGNPKLAYELVREAGPLSENPIKEQRFMAGWLALRKLADPVRAEPHFRGFRAAADGPLSRAKADYWLGRMAEAKGAKGEATEHYRAAAKERDTFHGLLARQRLEPGRRPIAIRPPAEPDRQEIASFLAMKPAQAAVIAERAGLGPAVTRPLLVNLRTRVKSESWSAMSAHLAKRLGDTQMSLRLAKSAIADGQDLIIYAYPVHALPSFKPLSEPPETAMLLAIARQETEFNTKIVSGAGARGILQVMPVTARHVCRDYKISCDIPRLLTDSSYNTMIAAAYIGDRMREFSSNYVLTLAGYNAGPGRARQWIGKLGDPRSAKVDAIDWIERIPFEETRGYVAKVLSNVQIYRARLGLEAPLRLAEDLGLEPRRIREAEQAPAHGPLRREASGGG